MHVPLIRCNNHRRVELAVVQADDKTIIVKPCPLCQAVAVVKTKREVRKNLIESLNEGVFPNA